MPKVQVTFDVGDKTEEFVKAIEETGKVVFTEGTTVTEIPIGDLQIIEE